MFLISSGNIANLLAFLALLTSFLFIAVLGCPSIPGFVGVAAPDMLSLTKLSGSNLGVCGCHHCVDTSRPASTGSTSSSKKLKRVGFAVQLEEVIPILINGDVSTYWYDKWKYCYCKACKTLVWRSYFRVLDKGWFESF